MLHYAAMGNSLWIGELLISKGADINAKTKRYNETPLILALRNRQEDMAELLLEKGADIDAKDIINHKDNNQIFH